MASRMSTYCHGYEIKTTQDITKSHIVALCQLANTRFKDQDIQLEPERISEGGILYKFNNPESHKYKSIRFHHGNTPSVEWPYIYQGDVMDEWSQSNDIIFRKGIKMDTFLKSFNGSPPFTIEELKIWEECFNHIGIVKIGKYPSKRRLTTV